MKKSNLYLFLTVGALGVLALSTKLTAATDTMPSCCMGGMTTPMASEVSTNATPDLLTTCPVSGEKLGEMGKPYVFTHEGREIKLCCKSCLKDFKKDPAKYVKKIEEAEARAKK